MVRSFTQSKRPRTESSWPSRLAWSQVSGLRRYKSARGGQPSAPIAPPELTALFSLVLAPPAFDLRESRCETTDMTGWRAAYVQRSGGRDFAYSQCGGRRRRGCRGSRDCNWSPSCSCSCSCRTGEGGCGLLFLGRLCGLLRRCLLRRSGAILTGARLDGKGRCWSWCVGGCKEVGLYAGPVEHPLVGGPQHGGDEDAGSNVASRTIPFLDNDALVVHLSSVRLGQALGGLVVTGDDDGCIRDRDAARGVRVRCGVAHST
jgi:hypothetical protein